MIITRGYANKLCREGKAMKDGATYDNDQRYQIVIRHDMQRVDHYPLDPGSLAIIQLKRIGATT
jgi:hypothetical protein